MDTNEVLAVVKTQDGEREIVAAADASYIEKEHCLVVKVDAFLRSTSLLTKEQHFTADWLPKRETVREHVGPDETVDLARDIFQGWVRKVREATEKRRHQIP